MANVGSSTNMSSTYETYLNRKKRTVELQVSPGKHTLDRTDFCPLIEQLVGLESLLAFGPTSERGGFQMTFTTEDAANKFYQYGTFYIHDRTVKNKHGSGS